MPLLNWTSDQTIYKARDTANEISILIKGSVEMFSGDGSVTLRPGDIIGIAERPGKKRRFSYRALGDATTYSYPYASHDDLVTLINENEKLSSTITSRMIQFAGALSDVCEGLFSQIKDEYDTLMKDIKDYPSLCAKSGHTPTDHSELETIPAPNIKKSYAPWQKAYYDSLCKNESHLFNLLATGKDVCIGFSMDTLDFISKVSEEIHSVQSALDKFHHTTAKFRMEINLLHNNAEAIASGASEMAMPSMADALSQILMFADMDEETSSAITEAVSSYVRIEDRTDTSDTLRAVRRKVTEYFYILYEAVFRKYLDEADLPPVVKMFLTFGFMDERIVDKSDMEAMYGFAMAYVPSDSRIVTLYEWLQRIHDMEVEPSLNEFQLEYSAYLRECRQNGDITEEKMKEMLDDPDARLSYEIRNLFTLGNRMTFGRVSIFVPIYDSQTRMLPPERAYMSRERLTEEINRIRDVDYSCFYRERILTIPASKALSDGLQLFVHEEQPPYMILFPIVGSHMVLWQNIEGRKRNTPARMLIPIFYEDDLSDGITTLCGEYRWEVCKTDQGVHWNDITDPSLTAEYNDFLQFYRKNGSLSADHKEKIKTAIKKHSNNYKKVFVSDYLMYMKYESAGNMRLLRQQREMLFKYCPFGPGIKSNLMTSPQYEKLIEIRANKQEQKLRPLNNVVLKMEHVGEEPPQELLDEIKFLEN